MSAQSLPPSDEKILAELVGLNADTSECVLPLHAIAVLKKPHFILELGVRSGISTRALLVACRKTDGCLISLDIAPCEEAKKKIKELGLEKHWIFIQRDDKELMTIWKYGKVDMIFLDSDHDEAHTKQELEICHKVLKKGGLILVHDTLAPNYAGIMKAVKVFLGEHKKQYNFFELGSRYGLGMLAKK